jgi:hypothetical protein
MADKFAIVTGASSGIGLSLNLPDVGTISPSRPREIA